MQIIGSLVELLGDMYFANNTVKGDSAALQLLSFAQVRLHHGLNMTFENNVGKSVNTLHIACTDCTHHAHIGQFEHMGTCICNLLSVYMHYLMLR